MTGLSPDEALTVVRSPEARGGPTIYTYRGARITAWTASHGLHLTGHPYDGLYFGNTPHVMQLIDWWRDKGRMPPGYVWPAPAV